MDKLLLFPGKSDSGIFTYVVDAEKNYLEKTASQYHPTIASYINSAKPIKGKTQILLTALGAGEFWGNNVNGDYFPEAALAHEGPDYGYKTFETMAKVYKHHINKDPTAAYGDVALSVYNPAFHRVELIVMLDNKRAPDIVERIESGDYPDWSMGCRVPYDVCSICGNKAPTRKQYCEHLRYYIGKIHPTTGKMAYAINTMPKFFDISQVLIGADRIAKTHRKVASSVQHKPSFAVSSALLAEKMAATSKSADIKVADIEKQVPATEAPASQQSLKDLARGIMEVKSREASLPRSLLNRLGSFPLSESMSTLAMLGILPKPAEFQRIVLVHMGAGSAADDLDRRRVAFDPMSCECPSKEHESRLGLSAGAFNPMLLQLLLPHLSARSYMLPLLARRVGELDKFAGTDEPLPTLIKVADNDKKERSPLGIIPMLALAAGLYAVYSKGAGVQAAKGLDKVLSSNPGLAAALGLGLYTTFNSLAKPGVKGNFISGEYINPDVNDVASRIERGRQKPFMKVGGLLGPASKRILLGIPAAYMASGVLQKHRELNPYDEEGRIKSFLRRNPDVVSGALIADAMLSAKGGGTSKLIKSFGSLSGKAKEGLNTFKSANFSKAAFADPQDYVSNAVIWPLALGGVNPAAKMLGGAFDTFVLSKMKQMSEGKQKKDQGK